jgi:hypothetical protein
MKSNDEHKIDLLAIPSMSQLPKYAINELIYYMKHDTKITYAIKMQSSKWLYWVLIFLFWMTISLIVRGALIGLLFFYIIIPYFTQKVVVFSDKAIFIFPFFNKDDYRIILVQDIRDVKIQKGALIINTNDHKLKFNRSWGLKDVEKQGMIHAINELFKDA